MTEEMSAIAEQKRPVRASGPLFDLVRGMIPESLRVLAAACAGDRDALHRLAADPESLASASAHRLAPRLAIVSRDMFPSPPEEGSVPHLWRLALLGSAANRMRLDHALGQVGQVLGDAGIEWMPLKGMAFSRDVYPDPAERPTSDLDVLVLPEFVERARHLLVESGWTACDRTAEEEDFVRSEGYNWKLLSRHGVSLELHFRLWGTVPEGLAREVFSAAASDPTLGSAGRRPRPADMYILGAVHLWLDPGPHPLVYWWDLACIAEAAGSEFASDVAELCERWGLQLFVALSSAVTAELWGGEVHREIAARTWRSLRFPERLAARCLRRRTAPMAPLEVLAAARLLAGRPSRSGMRAVWRKVWPHRAIRHSVARERDDSVRSRLACFRRALWRDNG